MVDPSLASVRTRLEAIETDLREAAAIADPLVRKILTSVLRRQAEYHRDLLRVRESERQRRES